MLTAYLLLLTFTNVLSLYLAVGNAFRVPHVGFSVNNSILHVVPSTNLQCVES